MHVDHELVEFMPADKHDYKEIIEEYEEEILIQERALKPFMLTHRLPKASPGA